MDGSRVDKVIDLPAILGAAHLFVDLEGSLKEGLFHRAFGAFLLPALIGLIAKPARRVAESFLEVAIGLYDPVAVIHYGYVSRDILEEDLKLFAPPVQVAFSSMDSALHGMTPPD
jgi:hypothetical protein